MIKEVKYGGITTTPSDYESKDGDLASSSGIVLDEGRVLVTRKPTDSKPFRGDMTNEPLFIHNTTDGQKVYIMYGDSKLWYRLPDPPVADPDVPSTDQEIVDAPTSRPKKIDAIGNTLICLYDDGSVHYVVFKNGAYVYKGTHIPTVELQFGLFAENSVTRDELEVSTTDFYCKNFDTASEDHFTMIVPDNKIDTFTKNLYSQAEKLLNEKYFEEGKFMYPFFVRYALKLYDGSYTNISAPILMYSNYGMFPVFGFFPEAGSVPSTLVGYRMVRFEHTYVYALCSELKAKLNSDTNLLDGWEDIVKCVDIFISSPLMTFDTLEPIGDECHINTNAPIDDKWSPGNSYYCAQRGTIYNRSSYLGVVGNSNLISFSAPYSSIEEKALRTSTFYLLYSYKLGETNGHYGNSGLVASFETIPFDKKVLPVLETQKVLPDDYYSNDNIKANALFTYNSRINLANISRQLFSGFSPKDLMPPYADEASEYITVATENVRYYVVLEENGVNTVVASDQEGVKCILYNSAGKTRGLLPEIYFYPNPNAKKLIVERTENNYDYYYYEFVLNPHPTLNGAYISFVEDDTVGAGSSTRPSEIPASLADYDPSPIPYSSQIYTSEPYNPYVFKAENINQLPIAANILNIASTTQPMSQGQFGQYPLYVFSDMGIFALELASNGNFSGLTPVTRDIILGDGSSLTQLDDSLLFATKQGIMELVGKNTRCISTELDVEGSALTLTDIGKITDPTSQSPEPPTVTDFKTFISGCKMVYDYVNARIIVFNPTMGYSYVYSAKDKAWSIIDRYDLIDTINAYPEAQAVAETTTTTGGTTTTTYSIIDLSTITDEEEAEQGQIPTNEGWFITRPISLDADNNFKFIDTIRQNGVFEEYMVKENGEYKGYNAVASRNNPEIGDPVYAETGAHEVVRQVLYGSNDLINWFVCGSSRSRYITELKGAQFKWYRLAVRTKFKYGESLSSVTFSYRIKAENPHLF